MSAVPPSPAHTTTLTSAFPFSSRAADRPLLEDPDRGARVRSLLSEREAAYKDSDMILDTTADSITDVVRKIKIFVEKLDC